MERIRPLTQNQTYNQMCPCQALIGYRLVLGDMSTAGRTSMISVWAHTCRFLQIPAHVFSKLLSVHMTPQDGRHIGLRIRTALSKV